MCGTVKRTPYFPFVDAQKITKYKREHVNENGVSYYKVNKLKVLKASGTTVNASCCRNSNGSCVLGLGSHLESNYTHWDCAIKHGSYFKKCKNYTHSWCDCKK